MKLWPHQQRCLDELMPRIGSKGRYCVVSPTGGGKSKILTNLLESGLRSVIYTNRRMLLDQLASDLDRENLEFGYRVAGHKPALLKDIQLASIQTELSRVIKKGNREIHNAELVLIDEAHLNKQDTMVELIRRHGNACVVGFTATPVGIGHIYDSFIQAGTKSELRECGALVYAHTYAPDEPDTKGIKRQKSGEYKYGDVVKVIMTQTIFGRVVDHWKRLNPDGRPTLLFAPGKKESLWFAEQFAKQGIRSAHIDGDSVWLDGELHESSRDIREHVRDLCEAGDVKIVCNRFVLREGINWPFLYHGIFATMFGSLSSFLQSGGRLLRAHPSLDRVIIQDHGGSWHRHGSLNVDRDWDLDSDDYVIAKTREKRLREKKEQEPILCPECFAPRLSGPVCHDCGHQSNGKSRMVSQIDGKLKEMSGDIYKEPVEYKKHDAQKKWDACYWRCLKSGKTFNQVRGLFMYENYFQAPPKDLHMMPKADGDWFRKVREVSKESLT